jgi:hypothetical protein
MSDDFIHQFEPPRPPRPEFTAALYQRINQPMKTTPRSRALRTVALSFAMVAVVAAILFLSPSARAFADSIIQQFQKGNVMIQTTNDINEASQLAGFTVLAPTYLPNGYIVNNQHGAWTVSHDNGDVGAIIFYDNQASNGHLSILEQMGRQGEPNALMNRPGRQDVTVRGQTGAWIPADGKSTLIWNENGITYTIITNLPKEEVLKVAESLGK